VYVVRPRRAVRAVVRSLALAAIREGKYSQKYDHVFVDEVQDLTPVGVRVLVGLCRSPEDVCLAVDGNQSVYARGFGWRHVHEELQFQGRTIQLRRGYRTTREILAAATAALGGSEPSDPESLDIEGTPSGERPVLHHYTTPAGHARAIANFLRSARLRVGIGWSGAAVLCPQRKAAEALAALLRKEGVPARVAWDRTTRPAGEEVTVMTIHSSKGLEFPVAVVADLRAGEFPRTLWLTPEEQQEETASCRRLFFVGATRAMREVLVTAPATDPSPILLGVREDDWRRTSEQLSRPPAQSHSSTKAT
jgi:superfamily I DNA/RNA helicase